jgi:hypothetical protein
MFQKYLYVGWQVRANMKSLYNSVLMFIGQGELI